MSCAHLMRQKIPKHPTFEILIPVLQISIKVENVSKVESVSVSFAYQVE